MALLFKLLTVDNSLGRVNAKSQHHQNRNQSHHFSKRACTCLDVHCRPHGYSLLVLSAAGLLYFVFSYDGNEYAEVKRMGDEIASIANDVPQTEETDASDEPGMEIGKLYSRDPMDRELNWDGILEINADNTHKCKDGPRRILYLYTPAESRT